MSNEVAAPNLDLSTVEKLRAFLKKAPPQGADQQVFGSAVLAHLEAKEKAIRFLLRKLKLMETTVGLLARKLHETGVIQLTAEAPEDAAEGAEAAATGEPERQHDATPFPAGVTPGGPAAPAPGAPKTGPIDDDEELKPNVQSGPPTNAAPIPNKVAPGPQPVPQAPKAQKNGSKVEAAK